MEISPGLDLVWREEHCMSTPRSVAYLNGLAFASAHEIAYGWIVRWLQIPWHRRYSHVAVASRAEAEALVEFHVRALAAVPWGESA